MSHDRGCPCGRESYDYDVCDDVECTKRGKRMFLPEPKLTKSKYVWEKPDGSCEIIEDPIKIVGRDDIVQGEDKFYRLGEEVAVQVTLVKVGKTYR